MQDFSCVTLYILSAIELPINLLAGNIGCPAVLGILNVVISIRLILAQHYETNVGKMLANVVPTLNLMSTQPFAYTTTQPSNYIGPT